MTDIYQLFPFYRVFSDLINKFNIEAPIPKGPICLPAISLLFLYSKSLKFSEIKFRLIETTGASKILM